MISLYVSKNTTFTVSFSDTVYNQIELVVMEKDGKFNVTSEFDVEVDNLEDFVLGLKMLAKEIEEKMIIKYK